MSPTPRVLVTCKQMQNELPKYRESLEELGFELIVPELTGQQFSAEELTKYADGVVGVIAGDDELNAHFFHSFTDLKVLIRWGIGMDSVDHAAAAAHGVAVRNTPGAFSHEVADSAMSYVMSLARGNLEVDARVRRGEWPKWEGVTLNERRMGVVGLGAIGREVAKRAVAFGMRVVGSDPYIDDASVPPYVGLVSLQELLTTSDFIVLTCPYTPQTHHLINQESIRYIKSHAFIVNVSRGPVIDEDALILALSQGRLAGAGLDVFEVEPLPMTSELRNLDHVILGAHNGSNTREGVARASSMAVGFLLEELEK